MQTRREIMGAAAAAIAAASLSRTARASSASLLVSVLTCRRPHGVSYLEGTLASVDAEIPAGIPRLLVCDGEEVLADGWTSAVVPARERERGALPDNKVPGWVAIRTAWTMGVDLLFLEDDVRGMRRGAFAEMLSHEVPARAAFTSFFGKHRAPGFYPARDFRQSQAVKIPNRSLGALVAAEREHPFQMRAVIGVDLAIGVACGIEGWSFEQTHNLVEHIGLWSAANPT